MAGVVSTVGRRRRKVEVVVVDAILPKRSCQHARAIRRIVVVVDAILPKRSCQRSIVVVKINSSSRRTRVPDLTLDR